MNATYKLVCSIALTALVAGCGDDGSSSAPETPGPTSKANYPAGTKGEKVIKPPAPPIAKPSEANKADEPPAVEGPKAENSAPGAGSTKLTAAELAAIKELPASEQAAALAQAVCPVSAHHLGSMDKPFKVTAEGRTFYLCCEGCEDKLKDDPKAVIAKLDKK
jgi:YHS domain-containing protein